MFVVVVEELTEGLREVLGVSDELVVDDGETVFVTLEEELLEGGHSPLVELQNPFKNLAGRELQTNV